MEHVSAGGLPVLAESLEAVRALRGRSTLSAKPLESLAAADAALALNVLRSAGEPSSESAARERSRVPEHFTHALLLLGVEPASRLMTQLPSLDTVIPRANRSGLVRVLARASHATLLADRWVEQRGYRNAQSIRVAVQVQHLGALAAWACHPTASRCFEELSGAPAAERAQAEARLLGVELAALARALAEHWGIPEFARFCLEPENARHPQAALVVLATRVAAAACGGWYGKEMARCQSLVAETLQLELDVAISAMHADTARAARSFARPHELVAARYLMLAPGDEPLASVQAPEAAPQAGRTRTDASAAPSRRRETAREADHRSRALPADDRSGRGLKPCLGLLEACRTGRVPLQKALGRLVHEMRTALGVDRVMLAFLSRDRRVLAARFSSSAQPDPEEALVRLRLPLDKQHLFTRLMQKPQGVWLNPSNRAKVWPLVPPGLHGVLSRHTFLAMSLFVGKRPVGLFYADCLSNAEQIDESSYRHFKHLCKATSRALAARPR